MNIIVWNNFTKRKNSTLQPGSGTGTTISCYLKEDTSIESPVFILETGIADYTYVQAFSHYYFVTDVVNLDANRCELHCTMDVLATYKSDITGYTAFVERSASLHDDFINDVFLSSRQIVTHIDQATTQTNLFNTGGCFISQCLAHDNGIVLYASGDLSIYKRILDPNNYTAASVTEWIDSKIAQAFDLDVYIGSIKWIPIGANHIGTRTNHFYVGPIDVGIPTNYDLYVADQITDRRWTLYGVQIPQTHKFSDFRDTNPRFSRYKIRLPGIGLVELDPMIIGSIINSTSKRLDLQMDIDFVTGDIVYYLIEASGQNFGTQRIFARYNGNISVNVPIAKSSADLGKTIGTFTSGVANGAASGGAVGAIVGGVVGAVGAIMNEMTPDTSHVGGSGNKSDIGLCVANILVTCEHYGDAQFTTQTLGKPLYQNVLLSTLSGYVKCAGASVPVNCHDQDRDVLNNYLNSGFYIE